ncbi:hypothetical protein B0A48_11085 [Cryoendolithus antarcticus]|uniref:SWR1-complex protein 4 n=1 Tax=Cryoendolithus antarcticus TaxID=1507870 RepID=A0A1V8SV94_9PEZI|nr:hypothetical protein B0A48_11085 [Cryoendolithus antarcticus]
MAAVEKRPSTGVRTFKRARVSRPPAHWERSQAGNRSDLPTITHWQKANTEAPSFAKYNVDLEVPVFDDETYEAHLADPNWTLEETRHLVNVYQEASGKWPVIIDWYGRPERTMEDLKARFYKLRAILLQLATPIQSMAAPEYTLYETLTNFNPQQELSRKRLAENLLHRKKDEADEEAVLLAELQRIMANQASLDESREDLRRRLDYPKATSSSYQYSTSQALSNLWQQLISADRMRKTQRLRPVGPQSAMSVDGTNAPGQTPTSARARESMTRNSQDPTSGSASRLSEHDMARFGVSLAPGNEKLPAGVTFASDRLSKPRIAKSTIQSEKIAAILQHIGVPDLIPLPTPAVIEAFDGLMGKVHALLEMRKVAEKEEQELRVREAEAAQ